MRFEGAIVTEQNVTFGIAIVKPYILDNHAGADELIVKYRLIMKVPVVVLMAKDMRGVPTYYGRKDVVAFLADIDQARIPWKRFTFESQVR